MCGADLSVVAAHVGAILPFEPARGGGSCSDWVPGRLGQSPPFQPVSCVFLSSSFWEGMRMQGLAIRHRQGGCLPLPGGPVKAAI